MDQNQNQEVINNSSQKYIDNNDNQKQDSQKQSQNDLNNNDKNSQNQDNLNEKDKQDERQQDKQKPHKAVGQDGVVNQDEGTCRVLMCAPVWLTCKCYLIYMIIHDFCIAGGLGYLSYAKITEETPSFSKLLKNPMLQGEIAGIFSLFLIVQCVFLSMKRFPCAIMFIKLLVSIVVFLACFILFLYLLLVEVSTEGDSLKKMQETTFKLSEDMRDTIDKNTLIFISASGAFSIFFFYYVYSTYLLHYCVKYLYKPPPKINKVIPIQEDKDEKNNDKEDNDENDNQNNIDKLDADDKMNDLNSNNNNEKNQLLNENETSPGDDIENQGENLPKSRKSLRNSTQNSNISSNNNKNINNHNHEHKHKHHHNHQNNKQLQQDEDQKKSFNAATKNIEATYKFQSTKLLDDKGHQLHLILPMAIAKPNN